MKRDEKFNYEEMRCKWEIANNRHDARVLSSIGPRLYGHYTTAIISIRWPDNHMNETRVQYYNIELLLTGCYPIFDLNLSLRIYRL